MAKQTIKKPGVCSKCGGKEFYNTLAGYCCWDCDTPVPKVEL